ncbi:DUF2945 domain-containing protein [Rhizobium sp. BE258]|jgi:hypothetical protein|uniref:DUF2945 domain-containing protein n=1 Tax=Rhizobium sp. BE258 TaxID=2817722 RepID=UPI002860BD71|nr:DUF2945 domain-containing protein [Rhizobium sp. BE258]MDR7146291.1 hypothetical protein [Rhizobium sp. BE258]
MQKYRTGTSVEWTWGKGKGTGRIAESFTEDVERIIEGADIKRKATSEEPAYLIEQEDGGKVLKGHSEIRKVH